MARNNDSRVGERHQPTIANDNDDEARTRKTGASPSTQEGRAPESVGEGSRRYLALLAVIVGVALLYWLTTVFIDWNRMQACLGYGQRSCAPTIQLNDGR